MKRKLCVLCGKVVPEHDTPPYHGHSEDCQLIQQWVPPWDRLRAWLKVQYSRTQGTAPTMWDALPAASVLKEVLRKMEELEDK